MAETNQMTRSLDDVLKEIKCYFMIITIVDNNLTHLGYLLNFKLIQYEKNVNKDIFLLTKHHHNLY